MSGEFLIEGPEDFKKELEFDKFMDEILIKETTNKSIKQSDGKGENARKLIEEYSERPGNSTRWRK
jgi:hypothetical protein